MTSKRKRRRKHERASRTDNGRCSSKSKRGQSAGRRASLLLRHWILVCLLLHIGSRAAHIYVDQALSGLEGQELFSLVQALN